MLEPVAPATLWLFPDLKLLGGTEQRSALAAARSTACRHWMSRLLRFSATAIPLLAIWLDQVSRFNVPVSLYFIFLVLLLSSPLFDYFRTRAELSAAVTPGANRADA